MTAHRVNEPQPCEDGDLRRGALCQDSVKDLAFAHWQYNANEKAYENRLITKAMYEFAREELRKTIERFSKICCGSG